MKHRFRAVLPPLNAGWINCNHAEYYTGLLIESNIDAIMTADPAGIITGVNKQMEALTGGTRDN